MIELAYRAFGALLPPIREPSLLHSSNLGHLPVLTFYMDDFFGDVSCFEKLYDFLRNHFFPRVEWARLRLWFKKLRLFEEAIKALGVTHHIGGRVQILEDRVRRIAGWPTPRDQTAVRGFLGCGRHHTQMNQELFRAISAFIQADRKGGMEVDRVGRPSFQDHKDQEHN